MREARAYAYNIYLMLGMPYLLLGTVGFLVYRGFRRARLQQLAAQVALAGAGDSACPSPSPAGGSWPAPSASGP
jgi:hypothetical protein